MRRYIFGERGGIYIIDLTKTQELLEEAHEFARNIAERNGTILFVGTKKQAQNAVTEHATRVGMPYVSNRWLGGLLTNWRTISERIAYLHDLRRLKTDGQLDAAALEGAHRDGGRPREARGEPRRRRRHEAPARRGLRHRPEEGAARRARDASARRPRDRARRHERGSGRGGVRHPGERRRDSLVRPRRARRRGRHRRGTLEGHDGRDGARAAAEPPRDAADRARGRSRAGAEAEPEAEPEPAAVAEGGEAE